MANRQQQYRDVCGRCGARRVDRQLGLEATPAAYVEQMVAVFREVRRVLRSDGTCWLNIGDSYATGTSADRNPTSTRGLRCQRRGRTARSRCAVIPSASSRKTS